MFSRPSVLFLVIALAAGAAFAQEYDRAFGGQLQFFTKQPNRLSGSFGFDTLRGGEATLGGTLLPDHLWFFGSMQRTSSSRLVSPVLPQVAPLSAGYGKIDANLGDRQSLQAIAARTQLATPTLSLVPASFLSMHYTGIISPNAFFTASVSQSVAHP